MFDTPPQQASKERQSPKQPIVKYKTSFKNCVLKALKNRNWKEADDDNDWDIYWGEKETIQDLLDRTHLNPNQRVNHFRNHFELTKKDHLMRNLKKYKRQLEKDGKIEEAIAYDFFPMTYNLPLEYPIFCDEFKRNGNSVWIMKPIGRSQGKGIFLFNKLNQISNWKLENRWKSDTPVEDYVVQKYIANPLLIGGKKFDMRIYCLVTSYSPLTVYLYREGFARFTHHRYTNHDLTNTYVHLTNVAIQKTSENYDEKLGGKWELTKLKQYLVSKYGQDKIDECFLKIQSLVLQTIQSVQKIIINDKHCFELYGFDVLLDDTLKPWLLEVNGSPSMTSNTPQDARLKCALLNDVFTIIDIEKRLTGTEEKIGGFDLISKVSLSKPITVSSTLLGGLEDRADIFNMLIKEMATSGAQLKAVQPERPLKSSGRILTTPNNKEKPGTPNSKEKSKENENMSAPKSSSTTENNFYTPKRSSSKIFLFDSTSIKTLTTENSTPETKPNLSSGRPKRILKALPQPVASIAQWKEMMMKDMKVVSQAVKVNQTSPKNQAKPATVMPPQQYITPLPFVNMTKALLEHEDPRALLPKKEPKSNQDSHRPFTAKSIKLVIQDERLTPKEGVRRVMMPEKKILRPSTTLGMMPNNSAVDLQGHKTSTQNNFNIFNTTMPGVKGTLADSLLIKQMKCEPLDDGEAGKNSKENKPHAPPGTPKNQEIKRPVKTCRIKLWSGKLNLQRKEEKESKAHEALNLAHSLKSSGLYKEIKVEGKV